MSDRCIGFGGSHSFEPRYDQKALSVEQIAEAKRGLASVAPWLFQAVAERIYVKDICTKCGLEIERE